MSLARCDKCTEIIDTDAEPEACVEHENYDFLCEWCKQEIEDYNEKKRE